MVAQTRSTFEKIGAGADPAAAAEREWSDPATRVDSQASANQPKLWDEALEYNLDSTKTF